MSQAGVTVAMWLKRILTSFLASTSFILGFQAGTTTPGKILATLMTFLEGFPRNFVSLSLFENEVRGWFHGLQSLGHLLHHRRVRHVFTAYKFRNFSCESLRAVSRVSDMDLAALSFIFQIPLQKMNIFSMWAIYTMHLINFSCTPGCQGSLSSHDPIFSQPASLPCTACVLGLRHATILDSAIFYLLLFYDSFSLSGFIISSFPVFPS